MVGGIKRISALSSKLVPLMFLLYLGSSFWIILSNLDKFWSIWDLIIKSAFTPYSLATGAVVGGIVTSMRWGMFKGIQTCEAGIGTQTIPHSMAQTNDPVAQATLAMMSTYTAGFIAFLSGFVALITETWLDPQLPLGMSMVAASFQHYFSTLGIVIVAISTFLFAFGTILGNSFNGSQCFYYLTNNKKGYLYLGGTAIMIFIGSISEVRIVWSLIDFVMAFIAIPHMTALVLYAYKNPNAIPLEQPAEPETSPAIPAM
jgi:AGCS family alanine or glycine:cation symporter